MKVLIPGIPIISQMNGKFQYIIDIIAKGLKVFSLPFVMIFLSPLLFQGCIDENILDTESTESQYGEEEEISLTFSMYLGQFPTTRADESIDNYIDKENLQVLFFDADGNFMFKDSNAKVEYTPDKNGQYYVTTSLTNSLKDDSGNSYLSLIRAKMESDNGFKIAVLGNWYVSSKNPYSVDWEWKESVFNEASTCKTINDLHHLNYNKEYSESYSWVVGKDGLGKDGLMGLNNSWVQYRDVEIGKGYEFSNSDEPAWHLDASDLDNSTKISSDAYIWIRNNWNPEKDKATANATEHGIYRHYANLWQLWNFGGGYEDNFCNYEDLGALKFASEWKTRNWTNPKTSDNAIGLESWINNDGYVIGDGKVIDNSLLDNSIVDGLRVISKSYIEGTSDKNKYIRSYRKEFDGEKYCGLILPEMDPQAYEGSKVGEETVKISSGYAYEYLNFSVPGTGTLRIIFSSLDENEATLVVQRGTTFEAKFTAPGNNVAGNVPIIKEITKTGSVVDLNGDNYGYLVKITEDAEDINLFCLEGNAVIYAIEYICGDYLKTTDREGILPSTNYPIPMYGVEDFPKITGWGSSKTINISQNGKTIYLIRALAKVEVYLPEDNNTLTHIYMRSMNQYAWCEPMDVSTSTYSLWKTHEENSGNIDNCEWYRIQAHGSGYRYNGPFNDWFGWFYGSWKSWWKNMESITVSDTQKSPQLFNPDIQRADFCHFIKDKNYSEGNLRRYYLYVPDKSISDPGNAGNLSNTPKVPHIEYRYNNNTDYLDDNDCYRIYFTDYSTNEAIKQVKWDGYETYEKSGTDGKYNIDHHWPIMRNHIYRFYVGTSNTPQEVRVKVLPWGDDEVKKVEW